MSGVFSSFLSSLSIIGQRHDDDAVDRLHYFVTSNLLLALSVLVSFKQFGGKPIECLVPERFTSAWEQYTENFCWAQGTYHVPFGENLQLDEKQKQNANVSYYQWVPFFLVIQAAFFRLPSLFWKCVSSHTGINVNDVVQTACDSRNVKASERCANVQELTVYLQKALRFHVHRSNSVKRNCLRPFHLPRCSFYVTAMFCVVKLLYLANVFLQLYAMNKFLRTGDRSLFGVLATSVGDLFGEVTKILGLNVKPEALFYWTAEMIRTMGNNVQPYSAQCVLLINIFNEKIFIFLWFWFILLAIVTAGSLVYWVVVMTLPWASMRFIKQHLYLSELPTNSDLLKPAKIDQIIRSHLRTDGVFVLRMLKTHAGILFGTELILELCLAFEMDEKENRSTWLAIGGRKGSAFRSRRLSAQNELLNRRVTLEYKEDERK